MEFEDQMKRLGKVQIKILLWLSSEEGVDTREEILRRWPARKTVPNPSVLQGLIEAVQAPGWNVPDWQWPFVLEEAPHIQYLHKEFLENLSPPGVPWSVQRFLGRSPTRSESATISKSLSDLEKRGLVEIHRKRGKRQRASHVSITAAGATAAVILRGPSAWD